MKSRILIVDDDPDMVTTLRDILRLRGWETGEAHSGNEAMEAQYRRPFDCVLMDIKMPGIDGVSASKVMRREFPELRVILMTAHEQTNVDDTARIISKPLDLPALFELLESANDEPSTTMH